MRSGAIRIDADLAATAVRVRAALPCSVQLPAGTGKTQIIAAVGTLAADAGERVLVLTHTNAGVDALRRRLRQFGAPARQVRVETIASWAHSLVRHYPQLAEVQVPEIPRGCDSETYYQGALLVATSTAIRGVLRASYRFAVVDEYQDCGASQHALVGAVSEAVPVAVFGCPLQSIFDFGGNGKHAAAAQGPLAGRPWQAGIAVRAGVTGGRVGRPAARHRAGGDHGKPGSAGAGPGGAAASAGRRGQEHLIFRAGHGDQVAGARQGADHRAGGGTAVTAGARQLAGAGRAPRGCGDGRPDADRHGDRGDPGPVTGPRRRKRAQQGTGHAGWFCHGRWRPDDTRG